MADATPTIEPVLRNPAKLVDLIDELRMAGYNLDLTHYIAAQDLLLALAARNEVPEQIQRLKGLLGPLLCTSPAEQAEFPRHFDQWAERLLHPTVPTAPPIDWHARWKRSVLLCIYFLLFSSLLQASHPPITSNSNYITSGAGFRAFIESTTGVFWQNWAWIILLLVVYLVWVVWHFYRTHLFLVRHVTTQTPKLEKVVVRSSTTAFFSPLRFHRLAQTLRRRIEIPSSELNIEVTLTETIRQMGWFTPIYSRHRVMPEYLILIDRADYHDHQARLVEELVRQLQTYNVLITLYAFNSDPRVCFPLDGKGAPFTLRDLAARHPNDRLVIFADVHHFFSPFTGELELWLSQLKGWSVRTLLTPEHSRNWSFREQELARHFNIIPATPEGLAQLMSSFSQQMPFISLDDTYRPRLPETLRTRPLRWLESHPPDSEEVETLLTDLRSYLDEAGFLWLCACAVYPTMDWNLTLYLGHTVQMADKQSLLDPVRMMTLARLPWLRYGNMPDWLRSQLIATLSQSQENAIRFALEELLKMDIEKADVSFELEIARRLRLSALVRPMLWLLIYRAKEDNGLHDYVFLRFMAHVSVSPLRFRLPALLGNRFVKRFQLSAYKYLGAFLSSRATWLLIALLTLSAIILLLFNLQFTGGWFTISTDYVSHFIVAFCF